MPTEGMNVLNCKFGYMDGDEFVEMGEMKDIPEISLTDDDDDSCITPLDFSGQFTITLKSKYQYKRRTLKWFRKNLMIDLLSLNFPKKKNRRAKRLKRGGKT